MKRRERGNWKFKLDGPKRGEGRGEKRSECEEGNFIAGETDWARRKKLTRGECGGNGQKDCGRIPSLSFAMGIANWPWGNGPTQGKGSTDL